MCTSPLLRLRLKTPLSHLPSHSPLKSFCESFDVRKKGYYFISLKKLQSCYSSFSLMYYELTKYCDYTCLKCRKCDECRMQYARDWSVRCYHEYQMRKVGCFLTLTVDSSKAHLFTDNMKNYCSRCKNGNRFIQYPIDYTLCKGFILDWLKRFRDVIYKRYGIKVRYFGCGEYGSINQRPHYHILLFGYDFMSNRKLLRNSDKGVPIFISEELTELWPYGIHTIQEINAQACIYTAKYCTKKMKYSDDMSEYEAYYGRQPEFLFMSKGNCQSNRCKYINDIIKNCKGLNKLKNLKNPYCNLCDLTRGGIGYDWLSRYFDDVVKLGYVVVDGIKYPIPKYYLDIINLTDENKYAKLKINQYKHIDELNELHPEYNSIEHLNAKKKVIKSKLKFSRRE